MTPPDAVDVVIVGAGPAGAAAATHLSRGGLSVLACERGSFPRDRLCGEFLSPDTVAALRRLDLEPSLATAPAIRRLLLSAPGGATLVRELPAPGLGLSRRVFDRELVARARSAGARVLETCRVRRVEGGLDSGFRSLVERGGDASWISSRAVVDASGRHGLFGHQAPAGTSALVAFKRHHRRGAARTHEDAVEIHAFSGGYCGINAVEDGILNACFLIRSSVLRAEGSPELVLSRAGGENEELGRRLEGLEPLGEDWLSTTCPVLPPRGPRSPRFFETGDAASMIAPVCGDGLGMALRAGELIGEALGQVAGGRSLAAALASYRRAWRREFRRRLLLGRALQAALLRPPAARLLVRAASALPAATDWFFRQTRELGTGPNFGGADRDFGAGGA